MVNGLVLVWSLNFYESSVLNIFLIIGVHFAEWGTIAVLIHIHAEFELSQ